MLKWFTAAVCAVFTTLACADQVAASRRRLEWLPQAFVADAQVLYVYGPVGKSIFKLANKIEQLSSESSEPITLVINSPGGAVLPGAQFVSAMRVAQSRGVKFRCVVPMLAASMAYIIFNECDERYALDNALFLWHDVAVQLFGVFTSKELQRIALDLEITAADYQQRLIQRMYIDSETYAEYYEFLIPGTQLVHIAPQYFTIVTDIKGVDRRFFQLDNDTREALDQYLQVGGQRSWTPPTGVGRD